MRYNVKQKVVVQMRREHLLVDQPTMENITASEKELELLRLQFNFTLMEAQIYWLMRGFVPVDLSSIPSARTHIHAMRRKLKKFSKVEINNLWRGVYELSIVGD